MTELGSFQSGGAMPVWALPNAPDMTKWTWEPPRPLSCSPKLSQQETEPGLPLAPEVTSQPGEPPQPSGTPANVRSETAKAQAAPSQFEDMRSPLGAGLQALYNTSFRTGKDFNMRFQSFLRLLQLEISLGKLRGMQIYMVYILARRVFVRAARDLPELEGASQLPLMSAIIEGMGAAKKLNPGFVTAQPRYWKILLKNLAREEIGEKAAGLFVLIMETMPVRCRFKTRGAMLNVLHSYFKIWQTPTIRGKPVKKYWPDASQSLGLASMWAGRVNDPCKTCIANLALGQVEQARLHLDKAQRIHEKARRFMLKTAYLMSDDRVLNKRIAEALKRHDPRVHRSLFVIATRLSSPSEVSWTRAHHNWLQILARLPWVDHSRFKKLLHLFPKRGRAALSHVELCDLFLLHWNSQGLLKRNLETRLFWSKTKGKDDSMAFAALALAINANHHPEECTVLLWSFWEFIRLRPGSKTVVKQILSISKHSSLSSGFLQRLAWTSNDARIVFLLHDVLVKQTGKQHNFWWPAFWDKFASQFSKMWKYPMIDPLAIAEKMLGPHPDERPVDTLLQTSNSKQLEGTKVRLPGNHIVENDPQSRNKPNKEIRQILRIKSSLKILTAAPQLTERQRIHYVASFTKFLAKVQGFLTARDLSSLTAVVTRVLDRGDVGSTERLKWYLGVIYEHLGEKACAQVGLTMRLRRDAIWRRQRDEPTSIKEETGQQRVVTLLQKDYQGPHTGKVWPLWRYHVPKNRVRTKRMSRLKAKPALPRARGNRRLSAVHNRPNKSDRNEAEMPLATEHERTCDGDALVNS